MTSALDLDSADEQVLTPRLRDSGRRMAFWALGVFVVLAVGFVIMVLQRAGQGPTDALDPDAATPQGARAVIEVLRGQGVDVRRSSTLAETIELVGDRTDVTVVLRDESTLLSDEQYAELLGLGSQLVLLAPGYTQLDILAPGIEPAGFLVSAETVLGAECSSELAERAQLISVTGIGYRIIDDPQAVGCFPGDIADTYGYVETANGGQRIAILGPENLLRNDAITTSGNAAFGLGLLGSEPLLIWYEPSAEDLRDADRVPTLQELTGPWVTPLAILIVLVIIATGVWQGRRFGPLVIERLPIDVRANETMEGRARLYARGDARGHAARALRTGAISRLAAHVGLPRTATTDDVVSAAATATGRARADLEALLGDVEPSSDAALMRLSDGLQTLEHEVAAAAGFHTQTPPRRSTDEKEGS